MNLLEHQGETFVSFKTAKKLKELGVPQESLFFWECINDTTFSIKFFPYCVPSDPGTTYYSAFNSSELMDRLPSFVGAYYQLTITKLIKGGYEVKYDWMRSDEYKISGNNLPEALSSMLILIEENKKNGKN